MKTFENILKRKINYYGKTEAAYNFAAEEYATIKMIEENVNVLRIAEKQGNGEIEFAMHNRISELEKMLEINVCKLCNGSGIDSVRPNEKCGWCYGDGKQINNNYGMSRTKS